MSGWFEQAMADRFAFDETDLAANRMLQMSTTQVQRAKQAAAATRSHLPKVLGILVVAAAAIGVFVVSQQQGDSKQTVLAVGAAGVAVVVVGAIAVSSSRRTAARLDTGAPVEMIDGPVFVRAPKFRLDSNSHRSSYREVGVDEVAILLDPEDAAAFEPGAHYRIYYADHWGNGSLSILSVERFD